MESARGRRAPGFTLVEIVVVIIIIGVIAAIAIPRLSRGPSAAARAAFAGDLAALRRAISFYAADHEGRYPAQDKKADTFVAQLTTRSDRSGEIGATTGVHICGPYLSAIPPISVGPNPGARGVLIKTNGQVYENQPDIGWVYNPETGAIYANTDDQDPDGVAYNSY